jgi:hypothetical protein
MNTYKVTYVKNGQELIGYIQAAGIMQARKLMLAPGDIEMIVRIEGL